MIDLHSHILPGLDDGARTDEDALAIARDAVADGVTAMAATPHLRDDHPDIVATDLPERCARLQRLLESERVPLEVLPGGEVDIHWAQRAADAELRAASLGGGGLWLLVETPYAAVTDLFEQLLFQLTARGFATLLAHPERNGSFQRTPERLRALVERGTRLQVTAHALTGSDRRAPARRLAEELVRESLAHVLASDVHRARTHRGGLAAAARAADALAPGAGRYLTEEAPAAILAGEDPRLPPASVHRRGGTGLWGRLRRA